MALTSRKARKLPSRKSGVVTSRGKGGGHDLRRVYTGARNVWFFILCDSYMIVSLNNYLLNYIHHLSNFLYVLYFIKNVTKSESHVLLSSVNFFEDLALKGRR